MTRRAAMSALILIGIGTSTLRAVDPNPARLAPTTEQAERAKELVSKLGDPVFIIRDEATRELKKLGRAALPILGETLKTTADPEVRNRCETLLPAIEEADLKARLELFLEDTEQKYDHKIPHWKEFSNITKDNPAARQLFAEILQTRVNRELFQCLDESKTVLEKAVVARRTVLYNMFYRSINGQRTTPKLADLFGLIFIETQSTINDRTYSYVYQSLLNQPQIRNAIAGDDGVPYRRLLAQWMNTRITSADIYQAFQLAAQLNSKDIPIQSLAIKLLETPGTPSIYRLNALTTSARTLGKDARPILAKAMEDKTAQNINWFINGAQIQHKIQVRDIALVMTLIVTEQDLDAYGVEQRNRVNLGTDLAKFSYMYYAFPDEKTREAAFEKFSLWDAKQKADPKSPAKAPAKPPVGK